MKFSLSFILNEKSLFLYWWINLLRVHCICRTRNVLLSFSFSFSLSLAWLNDSIVVRVSSFSEISILLIFSKVNNELIWFGKIFFLAKITNTHIEYKDRRDYYSNRHDIIWNKNGDSDYDDNDDDNPNIITCTWIRRKTAEAKSEWKKEFHTNGNSNSNNKIEIGKQIGGTQAASQRMYNRVDTFQCSVPARIFPTYSYLRALNEVLTAESGCMHTNLQYTILSACYISISLLLYICTEIKSARVAERNEGNFHIRWKAGSSGKRATNGRHVGRHIRNIMSGLDTC